MKTRRPESVSGMTLIELLVVVTISSLVITTIGGLYLAVLRMDQRRVTMQVLDETSSAMDLAAAELRQASRQPGSVMIWRQETSGNRHDILGIRSRPPQDQALRSAPSTWRYIVLNPTSGELRIMDQPFTEMSTSWSFLTTGRRLARHVQSFTVSRVGDLVEVTIVARKDGQNVRLQTAVRLEND